MAFEYYKERDGFILIKSITANTPQCNGAIYPTSTLEDIVFQINKYKTPILHENTGETYPGLNNSTGELNMWVNGGLDWDKICARCVDAFIFENQLYFYACTWLSSEKDVSTTRKRPSLERAIANGKPYTTERRFRYTPSTVNTIATKFGLANDFEAKIKGGDYTLRWIGEAQVNTATTVAKYNLRALKLVTKDRVNEYNAYNNISCSE